MKRLLLVLALLPTLAAAQGQYLGNGHYDKAPIWNEVQSQREIDRANQTYGSGSQIIPGAVSDCTMEGKKTSDQCLAEGAVRVQATLRESKAKMQAICAQYVNPDGTYSARWADCETVEKLK